MKIDQKFAQKLVHEQFPEWSLLPIHEVKNSGWDNRTFHLGSDMLIRIPRDEEHAPPILKEYQWLPKLASKLPILIPTPIALGQPSTECPWHWSINRWITGESLTKERTQDMSCFAKELGQFLKAFQSLDASGGPIAGTHNFYRGGSLRAYDHEMQAAIPKIENADEQAIATQLWQDALSSQWGKAPVWVHGDFAMGNILVEQGRLKAVIDFGQLAIGDPACDLVIAWNFFAGDSREVFKNTVQLDRNTWIRALGWAFWKTLCWPIKGTDVQSLLHVIYQEYQNIS